MAEDCDEKCVKLLANTRYYWRWAQGEFMHMTKIEKPTDSQIEALATKRARADVAQATADMKTRGGG